MKTSAFHTLFLFTIGMLAVPAFAKPDPLEEIPGNFRKENLIAWCIVPFDSRMRSPVERAEMLVDLGLKRVAYDWRKEHVPEFEEEILQYKQNGLEYFAFWGEHEEAFRLFEKHNIHPQIWKMLPALTAEGQVEKVQQAADLLEPLVKRCAGLGSKFGLYNHGGWGGEPENMVAVCRELHSRGYQHVGIVYNFHHAHDQVGRFAEVMAIVKPYLLCLNLNGTVDVSKVNEKTKENKILPIGTGRYEEDMIRQVIKSGYDGPIGILGHLPDQDVAISLQNNLDGLEKVLK